MKVRWLSIACSLMCALSIPCTPAFAASESEIMVASTQSPSEQVVLEKMLALQSQYPNGMTWTNDNYYRSNVLGGGYGCAGFSYILSDAAFGNNPAQRYYTLDLSKVRVGDILRIYNDTHSVVVLEVSSGGVTVAEGNINNSIYWGRFIPLSELQAGFSYGITRYVDEAPVTFPDVHEGDWYYEPVVWAVESGAMSGYGNGSFGPLGTLTRGQVATILHNLAGKPAADGSAVGEDFSDCSPEDFYAEAVAWAVDEGIFSGYNDGTFGPSAPMSREQLCVVLWRMQGEPESFQSLKRFPDAYDLSPFAEAAVRWAVEEGILQGNGQGMLNPVGALNRAEGATILMRYSEMFG